MNASVEAIQSNIQSVATTLLGHLSQEIDTAAQTELFAEVAMTFAQLRTASGMLQARLLTLEEARRVLGLCEQTSDFSESARGACQETHHLSQKLTHLSRQLVCGPHHLILQALAEAAELITVFFQLSVPRSVQ